MKKFNKFTEDLDKVAALKAKQRATVDKFKSSSKTPVKQEAERKVHSGDIETQNMVDKKRAVAKAAARKAEIRAEIQKEKQDK